MPAGLRPQAKRKERHKTLAMPESCPFVLNPKRKE